MRGRAPLIIVVSLLVASVIQTTLFGRIQFITPDLVLLVVIMTSLTKIRPEAMLALAFASGVAVDLLGSSLLGLRGIVFTCVAYVAIRTRERVESGRVVASLWAGLLTLIGSILLALIGTLFGQSTLLGESAVIRLALAPVANILIALALLPMFVRLVNHDQTAFRYP